MNEITLNEMNIVLAILKHPRTQWNASMLGREIGITPMGALKILKRLKDQQTLITESVAQSNVYKLAKSDYLTSYLIFLLKHEARDYQRWIKELEDIAAKAIILFGSTLTKSNPNDIDLLILTNQAQFERIKEEIAKINSINTKKLHPVYQNYEDLVNNLKKKDPVIESAFKGVTLKGEESIIKVYYESRKE